MNVISVFRVIYISQKGQQRNTLLTVPQAALNEVDIQNSVYG